MWEAIIFNHLDKSQRKWCQNGKESRKGRLWVPNNGPDLVRNDLVSTWCFSPRHTDRIQQSFLSCSRPSIIQTLPKKKKGWELQKSPSASRRKCFSSLNLRTASMLHWLESSLRLNAVTDFHSPTCECWGHMLLLCSHMGNQLGRLKIYGQLSMLWSHKLIEQ